MKRLIINVERTSSKKIGTMTVSDLRWFLEDFDDDEPVILSFDNGYAFGGIHCDDIREEDDESQEWEE